MKIEQLLNEIALFDGQITLHRTFIHEFIKNRFEPGLGAVSVKAAMNRWLSKKSDKRKMLNVVTEQKIQQLEVLFQINEMLIEYFGEPCSEQKQLLNEIKKLRQHI